MYAQIFSCVASWSVVLPKNCGGGAARQVRETSWAAREEEEAMVAAVVVVVGSLEGDWCEGIRRRWGRKGETGG